MLRRASSSASTPRNPTIRTSTAPSFPTRRQGSEPATFGSIPLDARPTADETINEEIDEIKRYEDFTTIDWVQDAAREQLRRRARRQEKASSFKRERGFRWQRKLWEAYDAAQGWIIVTLIGAAIGLNAAFLNIATEWLSDVKLGYCKTAFYLNEQFCCWGSEGGEQHEPFLRDGHRFMLSYLGCAEWHRWSPVPPINYLIYIIFSVSQYSYFVAKNR